ncbi:MAG: glycoside hydrolase family 2 [Tenericutes bacterium HGW-Tenericutes-1]|jgi:beta-mannosidase|nr:MAG: glycoside hydrolase family 2 [Tenericutes bacterium HGW-Tenericutes-1]
MKKISLAGKWLLTSNFKNVQCEGNVPGSVYQDLLNHQLIPDPFDQDNEYVVRDVMKFDFRYARSFVVPSLKDFHKFVLVCEGIDTLSDIYINNVLIANTDNMHRTWRFDLSKLLHEGTNSIEVFLKSPLEYISKKSEACQYPLYQARDAVKGYTHLRKGSSMFGWDWGPQLPDAGIWRDIYIELIEKARIDDILIKQHHHLNDSVELECDITSQIFYKDEPINLECEIIDSNGKIIYQHISTLKDKLHLNHTIFDAKKWYPIGYGKQPLYTLKISLVSHDLLLDEKQVRIGLRTATVLRENDQYGQSFTFVINGIKVFGKGADYIPEDNLLGRTNEELTRKLLQAAIQANHNMVRVWGGGIYPSDYFFNICDELGLLVWQDMMFACSVYDMTDLDWVETMKLEIKDNLIRMRHHPSIALICGNNENETAIEFWHVPSVEVSKEFYIEQYNEIIPEIVAEYFPQIDYWPSSPSSGTTFKDSNSDNYGDMHYWGVWHNNEPISYYRHYYPRFMSEFGIQSFPSIKTVKTFAREEDLNIFSYIMEQHQKNNTANDKILNYVGKMFRYPKDFESLLYVSQLIQAEGVRYGVEHWRRNYGRCMGALYWQLNDCWPVASWSSIDYYHRWKALHYHSKKFYQPILISIQENKNEADIYLTNDTLKDISGTITYKLMNFEGHVTLTESINVSIKAQSAEKYAHIETNLDHHALMDTVLYCNFVVAGEIVTENQVSFVPDKHLLFKKPTIEFKVEMINEEFIITLKSDRYAKYVELSFDESDEIFSDNYFFLIPNQPKKIQLSTQKSEEEVQSSLKIRSLFDTY